MPWAQAERGDKSTYPTLLGGVWQEPDLNEEAVISDPLFSTYQ